MSHGMRTGLHRPVARRRRRQFIPEPVGGVEDVYAYELQPGETPPIKSQSFLPEDLKRKYGEPREIKLAKSSSQFWNKLWFTIKAIFFVIFYSILAAFAVIIEGWTAFYLLGVWAVLFLAREENDSIFEIIRSSYDIFQFGMNYLIDELNYWLELMRPFIPAYNWYVYFQRIWWEIFWRVVTPELMVELLMIAITVVWEMMPVFSQLVQALIPALFQLITPLAAIVQTLFETFLQVFLDLVDLLAQFLVAVAEIIPPLILIFASFIDIVFTQFGPFLTLFIDMFVWVINVSIPFLSKLAMELVTIFTNVGDAIANNGGGAGSGGGGLGVFFDYLFLIITASLEFVMRFTITLIQMLIALVVDNMPRIVAFLIMLIKMIAGLIPPIVVLVIQLASTASFGVLVDLFKALVQAFLDLAPELYDVLVALINSGIIENLLFALLEGFTTAASPTFLVTFSEVMGDVVAGAPQAVTAFIITTLRIYVALIPLIIDIIVIVLSSGIINTLLSEIIEALNVLIPELVTVVIVLITDVFIKVIVQAFLESALDLVVALIDGLAVLIVGIPYVELVTLLFAIIQAVTDFIPKLIQIVIFIVGSSITVITELITALTDGLVALLVEDDFLRLVFDVYFAIVSGVMKLLFDIDATILQELFDIFYQLIEPFFDAVVSLVGQSVSILNPDVTGAGGLAGAATALLEGAVEFLTDIFEMLGQLLDLFIQIADLRAIYKLLYPIITFVFTPALTAWEEIIKPSLCSIDFPCCILFVDPFSCVFPGIGNCCCNDGPGGCPPPGCSCIF